MVDADVLEVLKKDVEIIQLKDYHGCKEHIDIIKNEMQGLLDKDNIDYRIELVPKEHWENIQINSPIRYKLSFYNKDEFVYKEDIELMKCKDMIIKNPEPHISRINTKGLVITGILVATLIVSYVLYNRKIRK